MLIANHREAGGMQNPEVKWNEMKVLITQSCLTLCEPTNCSPPGFSVHGILEARILQWIAILFSRGSNHGLLHCRQILYLWATGKSKILLVVTSIVRAQSLQTSPTLCNRMDWSLPGSSVHGIFQATVLEWVAIFFSRGASQPRDQTRVSRTAGRRFTLWATREAHPSKKPCAIPARSQPTPLQTLGSSAEKEKQMLLTLVTQRPSLLFRDHCWPLA